jgi:hypothetical protein
MSGRSFDAWHVPETSSAIVDESRIVEATGGGFRYPEVGIAAVEELCERLIAAREDLRSRSAKELAQLLGAVGERFLDPSDPLRGEALDCLPRTSGLSPQMSAAVLDGMAADWVGARLLTLLERELGQPEVLDGFVDQGEGRTMATGPSFTAQVVAGSVPGVGVSALIRSLLLKSPTLLKPGRGDVALPVLFARGLEEADPGLGRALAVLYWPGGQHDLEDVVLARADALIVYGGDETVTELRDRTPVTTRFVGYHHRFSVGIVGREALDSKHLDRVAAEVAGAVGFFDRRGCVSPQVVYVEEGGAVDGRTFAERLARALEAMEHDLPGGVLEPSEASALQQLRGTAELLSASDGAVELHHGGDASWTVLFEGAQRVEGSAPGRVIRVRPLRGLGEIVSELAPFSGHLQTVGVTGLGDRLQGLGRTLAELGVSRIVRFESIPFPPPWWHHDGRGPLRDLVRWVDLEGR